MGESLLESAVAAVPPVPPGRWAVAVSGGADSVAVLSLLHQRREMGGLHVVHLNHELRGAESDADARFVAELSARLGLPCTIGLRHQVEAKMAETGRLAKNSSARYRAARLAFFASVVAEGGLAGVILAHHADDQAETVLHRLLRGSGWVGLCGMRPRSILGGLTILRPLLGVRRAELRAYLAETGQPWREDSSNASEKCLRNRLRRVLADRAELTDELLRLAEYCRALRRWVAEHAPRLDKTFAIDALADLPGILARRSAGQWLVEQGAARRRGALSPRTIDLLLEMAQDAATPARLQVTGGVSVHRRRGRISADRSSG